MSEEKKKIKVLVISDFMLSPSGVGIQTRYMVEALLESGKFQVFHLAGAIKHDNYNIMKVDAYGDDLIIMPVDGYGTPDLIRSIIRQERPDILWFMTDPRFYYWLFMIENEIRPYVPMVYYTIWDGAADITAPMFNKPLYNSVDLNVAISKPTEKILAKVAPETEFVRIPHSINTEIFKKLPVADIEKFKKESSATVGNPYANLEKMIFFWNNRNAKRKMSGSILFWFKEFLDIIGHDKAMLIMHTEPLDENGQDLEEIVRHLELNKGQVLFSKEKVPPEVLSLIYNMVDCTINAATAEGFGLCLTNENYLTFFDGSIKSIAEVKKGDRVLIKNGLYGNVQATKERTTQSFLKIKTVGNFPLELTNEHPVLCYKRRKNPKNENKLFGIHCELNKLEETSQKSIDKELVWAKAEDINCGDFFVVPKPKLDKKLPEKLDLLDFLEKEKFKNLEFNENYIWTHKNCSYIKRYVKVDQKFLEFVGWYLAKGSSSAEKSIQLDLHKDEINIARAQGEYLRSAFEVPFCVYDEFQGGNRKNRSKLSVHTAILANFFEVLCGQGACNKRIHNILFQSAKYLGPMLKTLITGDGDHMKYFEKYRLKSISRTLISQIKDILATNGIYSCVLEEDNSGGFGEGTIFVLTTMTCHYQKLLEYTGLENWKQKGNRKILFEDKKKKPERRCIEKEDYFLVPVRKIEKIVKETKVYDIQIEDVKSFVANGVVVHNSTLESLACETPIIVNMTGGLQEQVTDGKEWFGIGIEPATKAIIGSQQVPYIYEDCVSGKDFVDALLKMYNTPKEERAEMGRKGRAHVLKDYNFDDFRKNWVKTLTELHEKYGSWENRKNYKSWELKEIK